MSSNEIELEPTEEEMASVSSTMFFLKVTGIVTLVLAAIILVSSPSLYMGMSEDSPEYHETEARNHVQKKDYEAAIKAYKKVLSFEPDRKDIFVRADHQIKNLKQLIARQKRAEEEVEKQEQKEKEEKEQEAKEGEGKTEGEEETKTEGKEKTKEEGKEETREEGKDTPEEETDDSGQTTPDTASEKKEPEGESGQSSDKKDEKSDPKTETDFPSPDDAGFD